MVLADVFGLQSVKKMCSTLTSTATECLDDAGSWRILARMREEPAGPDRSVHAGDGGATGAGGGASCARESGLRAANNASDTAHMRMTCMLRNQTLDARFQSGGRAKYRIQVDGYRYASRHIISRWRSHHGEHKATRGSAKEHQEGGSGSKTETNHLPSAQRDTHRAGKAGSESQEPEASCLEAHDRPEGNSEIVPRAVVEINFIPGFETQSDWAEGSLDAGARIERGIHV